MTVELPLISSPNRTFKVLLDGQECTIKLYQKGSRMFMDLTVNSTIVCTGAICLDLVPVIQVAQSTFSGNIVFVDILGDTPPQYTGLNSQYFAVYYTDDEDLTNITKMSI